MSYVEGLVNPQLLQLEDVIPITGYAFIVQCSNVCAPLLLGRNPSLIHPVYAELESSENADVPEEDRETPCVDASPTAWLFPEWNPKKVMYIFGTLESCDVVLPNDKFISRRHLAVYLSNNGVWMARNLSRYGTWLNGDLLGLPTMGEPLIRTALNPNTSNEVRMGNFECSIHPILHTPVTMHSEQAVSLLLQEIDQQSEGSRTTSASKTSSVYRPTHVTTETYHCLPNKNISVRGKPTVCVAIRKANGQYCIAKQYENHEQEKAFRQYEMMSPRLQNCRNCITYTDFADSATGKLIITPYLDGFRLCAYLGPDGRLLADLELAMVIYKQIAEALLDLKEHGIVHNDINENTILVEEHHRRYLAYLTGFSEFSMGHAAANDPYQQDISSLTNTVEKIFPSINGLPRCDPELRSLILQAHEGNVSVNELCVAIHDFAPNFERIPFQTSLVSRKMSIKRIVDDNDIQGLRLLDFLRIMLHQVPKDLKAVELAIKKIIRPERLFVVGDETYCALYDAEKLIHHLHREHHPRLLDLTPPKHAEACWYETTHEVNMSVSYHESTGMVNIAQIVNLLEPSLAQSIRGKLDMSSIQEIRGFPQWEGYYISRAAIRDILSLFFLPLKGYNWDDNEQCRPSVEVFGEDDVIAIATDEMIGLILYNREEENVTWGKRILTVEDAMQECEDHGLFLAGKTLAQVFSDSSYRTIYYGDEDIMKLFDQSDESDFPSQATSHASFLSEESIGFKFKKRKVKAKSDAESDILTLPEQWKFPDKEESRPEPVERVREWKRDIGPDMCRTKFIPSKEAAGPSRRR